ncbi:methionyl-tRNA formyltransferase [Ideonella sp. YS5]|uniref:methionyl-tRNA formyltransferase n=1 Tax=Ideonella sp. YS5 TaxID=3453714 RepID=UPI003EE8D78E
MRVAFAGTPDFAAAALAAIHAAGHTIPIVLTQPDRPAGRGMKLTPSPVKKFALAHGLDVAQPQGLKLDGKYATDAPAARAQLEAAAPDVMVVAAYGLILPRWVLELPRLGCLNIHASLLPRWRGAAPIHRAIEAGDAESGITIMQMDEGLDTGAMLALEREAIRPDDTTGRLHDRLAALGARMIVQALADADAGRLVATAQPPQGVTYAHKIDKAEAAIDWSLPAATIERRVRAFNPFPGASFESGGETIKVWQASLRPDLVGPAGRVLQADGQALVVACADGGLSLLELQRPGGKRLPATAFMQARPGLEGCDLQPH